MTWPISRRIYRDYSLDTNRAFLRRLLQHPAENFVELALISFHLRTLLNSLRAFLHKRKPFQKIWNRNIKALQDLKQEARMDHRPSIVSHALNPNLRLTRSWEFLKANVIWFPCHGLVKNRVAVLEKLDRYSQFKLRDSRLLWLFLWQF